MCAAFRICLNMDEAGCPLNIPGFLIYLNKTKYGWKSLEYAWISLKYNVEDTVKLLQKLDTIWKRGTHSELHQTSMTELLWKCLIWYYEYTVESEYALWICQGFEYAKGTQCSEYAWIFSCIVLEYVWTCLRQNLK